MPYKANEPRRHRIPKIRYKTENWGEYDAALRQRGSLTVWVRLSLFSQPGVEFLDPPPGVAQLVNETDPHARPLPSLTDCLGVGPVVLPAFHVTLDLLRRHQAHRRTEPGKFPYPRISRAAAERRNNQVDDPAGYS